MGPPASPEQVSFRVDRPERRAPFADAPTMGERGLRTQQRIMRASLEVFDEVGYHRAGIAHITARAGCSRPAFYQYFASKEDVFRRLFDDLGHRLVAVADALQPVTPDSLGWHALRDFVTDHAELYDRFAPLFHSSLTPAIATDSVLETRVEDVRLAMAERLRAAVRPRSRSRDLILPTLLLRAATRAHLYRDYLLGGRISSRARARVEDAVTDVMHRAFFGVVPGVNLRPRRPQPPLVVPPALARRHVAGGLGAPSGSVGRSTRARILEAGREVFATLGYHDVTVDAVVERAQVSHGIFYRYFQNIEDLFVVVADAASRRVAAVMADVPWGALVLPRGGSPAVRDWLGRHRKLYAHDHAVFRVWLEGNWFSPEFRAQGAAVMAQMYEPFVAQLAARPAGDPEADAFVLFAILDQVDAPLSKLDDGRRLPEVLLRFLRRAFACVD